MLKRAFGPWNIGGLRSRGVARARPQATMTRAFGPSEKANFRLMLATLSAGLNGA